MCCCFWNSQSEAHLHKDTSNLFRLFPSVTSFCVSLFHFFKSKFIGTFCRSYRLWFKHNDEFSVKQFLKCRSLHFFSTCYQRKSFILRKFQKKRTTFLSLLFTESLEKVMILIWRMEHQWIEQHAVMFFANIFFRPNSLWHYKSDLYEVYTWWWSLNLLQCLQSQARVHEFDRRSLKQKVVRCWKYLAKAEFTDEDWPQVYPVSFLIAWWQKAAGYGLVYSFQFCSKDLTCGLEIQSSLFDQGAIQKISERCKTKLELQKKRHHMHNNIQMEELNHLTGWCYWWLKEWQ